MFFFIIEPAAAHVVADMPYSDAVTFQVDGIYFMPGLRRQLEMCRIHIIAVMFDGCCIEQPYGIDAERRISFCPPDDQLRRNL